MWHLNLAALTEAELMALYGDSLPAKLGELAAAKLHKRPLLDAEIPDTLLGIEAEDRGSFGATPAQTRYLNDLTAKLRECQTTEEKTYQSHGENSWIRGWIALPDTALIIRWSEEPGQTGASIWLLSWLRDRVSGFSCVLTTNATPLSPAYSDEVAVYSIPEEHIHPSELETLLQRHRNHVGRQGKSQKIGSTKLVSWEQAWEDLYQLNREAWIKRKAIVEKIIPEPDA